MKDNTHTTDRKFFIAGCIILALFELLLVGAGIGIGYLIFA